VYKEGNGDRREIKVSLIAGLYTGVGKTTFTLGLLELFKTRNLVSFKVGPDYVDPVYHEVITGKRSPSLDSFFLPPEELKRHFCRCSWNSEFAIAEGVMGLLDGTIGGKPSTDDVACILDLPVVLLVESIPSVQTLAAMVEGVVDHADSRIVGIVLTKVRSADLLRKQMAVMKSVTGVDVIGGIPYDSRLFMPSRHLGLDTDFSGVREVASASAELIDKYCDVNRLFGSVEIRKVESVFSGFDKVVAVANDEAFLFFYPENLKWFEDAGYRVEFFSPLHDEVPPQADAYYLPGGYPEVHASQLSGNTAMIDAVREIAEEGVPVLAECGGFMYLTDFIGDERMVGFIRGKVKLSDKLQGFGYRDVCVLKESFLVLVYTLGLTSFTIVG